MGDVGMRGCKPCESCGAPTPFRVCNLCVTNPSRQAVDRIAALEAELAQARRDAERWKEVARVLEAEWRAAWTIPPPPGKFLDALLQARTGTLDPEPDDDSAG